MIISLCLQLDSIVITMEKQYFVSSLPSCSSGTFLNCCWFDGKITSPISKIYEEVLILGRMCVNDLLVLNFALEIKQVVFSTLVFSYDEQERFDSQWWFFFLWDSVLLCCSYDFNKLKPHRSTQVFTKVTYSKRSELRCKELWVNLSLCILQCMEQQGTFTLCLIHPLFHLSVVLWWCEVWLHCCSHHNTTGWLLSYQNILMKLHSPATFDVPSYCPTLKQKVCPVVCVLDLSSVHT